MTDQAIRLYALCRVETPPALRVSVREFPESYNYVVRVYLREGRTVSYAQVAVGEELMGNRNDHHLRRLVRKLVRDFQEKRHRHAFPPIMKWVPAFAGLSWQIITGYEPCVCGMTYGALRDQPDPQRTGGVGGVPALRMAGGCA